MKILKLSDCTTNEQRWDYYTHVYAWRILRGYGSLEDASCPIDPEGKWYDPDAVRIALEEMQRRDPTAQRNRAIAEQQGREADRVRQLWAENQGCSSFEAMLAVRDAHWEDDPIAYGLVNFEVMRWIVARNGGLKRIPLEPGEHPLPKAAKERMRSDSIHRALNELGVLSEEHGEEAAE